ncbi:hypothetical protein OUZ56_013984 [Daphnia magna]|uniref:Uncharacterized protein n=1 Tax=Daphnia magna TaxID=35525 RepID=A0ABQ9Z7I5_9CRUS|nr:hypothetical protein OUZ56_013984 [Daphnia magna]
MRGLFNVCNKKECPGTKKSGEVTARLRIWSLIFNISHTRRDQAYHGKCIAQPIFMARNNAIITSVKTSSI